MGYVLSNRVRRGGLRVVLWVVLVALWSSTAWAQASKPAASKPAASKPAASKPAASKPAVSKPAASKPAADDLDEPPPVSPQTKAEAKSHFVRGLKLLREEAWAPALAEFLLSRKLFPTRVATNNAAVALRKLQRYDESLAMWETMLRDFKVTEAQRDEAQRETAELRTLVGTIDISGAPPGASIVVDSEDRGEYPPVQPIRVPAGTHVVRLFKEGFEPYETRLDVAGGKTVSVEAALSKLADSGRLRISERSGRRLEVVVDSVVVGSTPWEGTLGVGDHMVSLRGVGKLGTQPVSANVKSQSLTTLALLAEQLDAQLRVNPVPAGASVWIDGVNVGNGVWLGRLKSGKHKVEAKSDGFLSLAETITLKTGQRRQLDFELERDDDAPRWRKPSKWTFDIAASLVITPTLAGDIADSCGNGCDNPIGLGGLGLLHGGYELGSGLGFGLEVGYLITTKTVRDRNAQVVPNGFSTPDSGTATDALRLHGLVAAATVGYHLGETVPVTLRAGAGIFYGELRDERDGRFLTRAGERFDAFPLVDFPTAAYLYIDPMARVGFRLLDNVELSASLRTIILVGLSQPRWDTTLAVAASSDGIATYPNEKLMGSSVLLPTVGLDMRAAF